MLGSVAALAELAGSTSREALRESIDLAARALAALEHLIARQVAAAVESDLPREDGAASATAWLARLTRWPRGRAAATMRTAEAHQRLQPSHGSSGVAAAAWAAGELSGDHAIVIGRALDSLSPTLPPAAVERAEAHLVAHVGGLSFDDFRILANRVVEVIDPEGADEILGERLAQEERRAMGQAALQVRKGVDGVAMVRGKIPNLHADMLLTSLEALASPRRDHLRRAECSATDAAPVGSTALADPHRVDPDSAQPIPYAQRLGRALCEWIEKLPPGGAPPGSALNATLVVTIDEQRLRDAVGTAALSTGDDLSASEARRLVCGAGILPMVLGGDSAPLDIGRSRRLFSPHQKLALAQRDGGCVFPGCGRPPAWTDAHHARLAWASGGMTDVRDGCLLCGFHHRLVHQGEWQIAFASDGIPEIVPPERVDPLRRPIRHERQKPRAG